MNLNKASNIELLCKALSCIGEIKLRYDVSFGGIPKVVENSHQLLIDTLRKHIEWEITTSSLSKTHSTTTRIFGD